MAEENAFQVPPCVCVRAHLCLIKFVYVCLCVYVFGVLLSVCLNLCVPLCISVCVCVLYVCLCVLSSDPAHVCLVHSGKERNSRPLISTW